MENNQIKASLTFNLEVNTNSRYGTSELSVMVHALETFRDGNLECAIKDLTNNNLEEAYDSFRDFKTADYLLMKMLHNLSDLAERNYLKSEGEATFNTASIASQNQARYEQFLKRYAGLTPVKDEDKAQKDDAGN